MIRFVEEKKKSSFGFFSDLMNFRSFFYNENFYRKVNLSIALIRLTPSDLTPRQFVVQIQKLVRQRQENRSKQIERIENEIKKFSRDKFSTFSSRPIDLLEFHRNFLEQIFISNDDEMKIEVQLTLVESFQRIFVLIRENLEKIDDEKVFLLFKQIFSLIFRFASTFPLFQRVSIEFLDDFLREIFEKFSRGKILKNVDLLVEHFGQIDVFFLLFQFENDSFRFVTRLFSRRYRKSFKTIRRFFREKFAEILRRNFEKTFRQFVKNERRISS